VGYLVDRHPVISGAAGYLGIKVVDYLVGKIMPEYGRGGGKDAEEVGSGDVKAGGGAERERRGAVPGEDL